MVYQRFQIREPWERARRVQLNKGFEDTWQRESWATPNQTQNSLLSSEHTEECFDVYHLETFFVTSA